MKDKSILFITTISGFLQKFEMQDVKMLQDMGWKIHYASNFENPIYECDREYLEENGIVCHNISVQKSPFALKGNYRALKEVLHIIKEEKIRALHCHNPVGGVIGRLAGRFGWEHPYVIYTAHGFHFYKGAPLKNWLMFYPVEKFLARDTDQLVTINREDEQMANRFRLRQNGRVSRIPGVGLDLERFYASAKERQNMRRKLEIPEEKFVLISVGELNGNKNHATVIRAVAQCKNPNLVYLICGEGNGRTYLEKLISELGVQHQVFLMGYQHQVEKYLQCADCFVFPSIREGLGMAALEGMACGLPIIVGDNRGTREYARENAIVCPAEKVEAYQEAIEKVEQDAELRKKMGERSHQIAKEFQIENTKRVMQQVYLTMGEQVG